MASPSGPSTDCVINTARVDQTASSDHISYEKGQNGSARNDPSEVLSRISNSAKAIVDQYVTRKTYPTDAKIGHLLTPERANLIRQHAQPGAARPLDQVIEEAFEIFSYSIQQDHPRKFNGIPCPSSPASWLADLLASTFNVFGGAWVAGSGPALIEDATIAWLASQLGLPPSAGGLFVSGGSMANMTAAAVARDQCLKPEQRPQAVAYISSQAHISVIKGLHTVGFVKSQIHIIPTDPMFRMQVAALAEHIVTDRKAGLIPFLIVATCGTTNTGAIDDLEAIADLAVSESLWMHVDGAYGASVALSQSHRHLVSGLRRADSVTWDAHKWLFQTFACGILLVKDKKNLVSTFATTADYLQDSVYADETPNFWNFGVEMTRPARAMKLWFTLQVLGLESIGSMIDHGFVLAETAEVELRRLEGWEITSPAAMAILTFRYVPAGDRWSEETIDQLNKDIVAKVAADNAAYTQTSKVGTNVVIRMVTIHPELTRSDLRQVIMAFDAAARELRAMR